METFQHFFDKNHYSVNGIRRYESIFGKTWISTGGEETTRNFCQSFIQLQSGMRVLDVGCGVGGSAFFMARNYGVFVYGIDLSSDMISIANNYRDQHVEPSVRHRVQFHVEDATSAKYPDNFYDIIYSRDSIFHIKNKETLFRHFFGTLKPGGSIFITDYCRGNRRSSPTGNGGGGGGNNLLTVKEYGRTLERVGFRNIRVLDNTDYFLRLSKRELEVFINDDEDEKNDVSKQIRASWEAQIRRCNDGEQVWGLFLGKKLFT